MRRYPLKTYTVTLTATVEVRAVNVAMAMKGAEDMRVIGSGGRIWKPGPHERDSTSVWTRLVETKKSIKPTE